MMQRSPARVAALLTSIALMAVASVALTNRFFPLPPRQVHLSVTQDAVADAQKYRSFLQTHLGIETVVDVEEATQTGGDSAVPRGNQIDAFFALGTSAPRQATVSATVQGSATPEYVALAVVDQYPVWLLLHHLQDDDLRQFKGGVVGYLKSNTFVPRLIEKMSEAYRFDPKLFIFQPMVASEVASKLRGDGIDLFVAVERTDAEILQTLIRVNKRHIAYLEHSDKLAKAFPNLSRITLQRASFDYASDVPNGPRSMLVAHRNLMARSDLHPALQRALIDAAMQVHSQPSLISKYGDFPHFKITDFPASSVAAEYAQGSRPWIEKVLTYWWAQLVTLLVYSLLPFALMCMTLLFILNRMNTRSTNRLLEMMFGDLATLESEMRRDLTEKPILASKYLRHLDLIDKKAAELSVPKACRDRWLTLRNHTANVRAHIFDQRGR